MRKLQPPNSIGQPKFAEKKSIHVDSSWFRYVILCKQWKNTCIKSRKHTFENSYKIFPVTDK